MLPNGVRGIGISVHKGHDDLSDIGPILDQAEALGVQAIELPIYDMDIVIAGRIRRPHMELLKAACRGRAAAYTAHGPLAINFFDDPVRLPRHFDVMQASMEVAAEVGAIHYVVHSGIMPVQPAEILEGAYERQREWLGRAGDFARDLGLLVYVETMFGGHEGRMHASAPSRLAAELAAIGHPNVWATLDFSHSYLRLGYFGGEFVREIATLAPFAKHLHMHDSFGRADDIWTYSQGEKLAFGHGDLHLPVGWGDIPWDALMAECVFPDGVVFNIELQKRYWHAAFGVRRGDTGAGPRGSLGGPRGRLGEGAMGQHGVDRVVVCVFDGLRPDLVSAERTPNLARFAGTATWFREARSVFPSMTRVATTSIATGAPPAVHGIVGNAFLFPQATRSHVIDTSRADDIALAERATGGGFVAVPTFADCLAREGCQVAVVHTGSAGSAHLINPRARANGHWTFSVLGRDHTGTPEAVDEVVARFGPLPPRELPRYEEIDYATTVFVERVLSELRSSVSLIWFNEPDTSFHYRGIGSPDSLAILRHVDAAFGRVLEWIGAQPDRDRYAVIAASDHGQISTTEQVDVAQLLKGAGHRAVWGGVRDLDGAELCLTGGNMGEIRILDGGERRRDRVATG
jgi:sugar phosphate isomerase/epimerase